MYLSGWSRCDSWSSCSCPACASAGLLNLIALSSPVAILVAVRLNRSPSTSCRGCLIALGQVFFVTGDVITYNYQRFFNNEPAVPIDRRRALPVRCIRVSSSASCSSIRHAEPGARPGQPRSTRLIVGDRRRRAVVGLPRSRRTAHDIGRSRSCRKLVSIGLPADGPDPAGHRSPSGLSVGGGRKNQACSSSCWPRSIALFVTDAIYGYVSGSTAATTTRPATSRAGGRRSTSCSAPRRCTHRCGLFSERSSEARADSPGPGWSSWLVVSAHR